MSSQEELPGTTTDTAPVTAADTRNTTRRRVLMLGVPAVLLALGAAVYLAGGRHTRTDNAYVKALTVDIAPEVAGKIIALPVKTNDRVKQGDLLLAIDRSDYEIAVAAAQSELYIQWARVEALRPELREVGEKKKKAEHEEQYYAREVQRLEDLRTQQAVSESQLAEMTHRRDAMRAEILALEQEFQRAGVALGFNVNLPKEKHPFYTLAQAKLDKAKLDLSRTKIVAPADGVITNKSIAAGDLVQPGRTVLSIVQDSEIWVEANLKETELADVHVGAAATVTLDVYPGVEYHGEVESISPATGAEFALLPPQNASGNWVKVVQRIPVRIRITANEGQPPLRAGLSADVAIDTGRNNWQRLFE
jgi:membrane fusion protein (multidrug efflux system)